MKKWENAEIMQLNVTETEYEWTPNWGFDGGYWGDGKVSGWFKSKNSNNCQPQPKPHNFCS